MKGRLLQVPHSSLVACHPKRADRLQTLPSYAPGHQANYQGQSPIPKGNGAAIRRANSQ